MLSLTTRLPAGNFRHELNSRSPGGSAVPVTTGFDGVGVVAAFGGGEVEALGPGPYIFSYDKVTDDGSIDVMVRWDHRITDAADIGTALSRLEQILNNLVADELLALAPEGQEPALHERIGARQVGRISR